MNADGNKDTSQVLLSQSQRQLFKAHRNLRLLVDIKK